MGNAFPSTSGKRWRALSYESCITSTSTKRLRNVSRPRIHHLLQTFRGNACPGWAEPAPNTARLSVRRTPGAKKKETQQHSKKYKDKKRGGKKKGRKRTEKGHKVAGSSGAPVERRQRGGRHRPCLPIPALRTETKQRINCDADGRL